MTRQPMRVSPLAAWNTTLVCMVPPCVGSGCAKTTAARGSLTGRSKRHSSVPAGPSISRTSANASPAVRVALNRLRKAGDEARELLRTRDQAEVSGVLDRDCFGVRPQAAVLARPVNGHDAIELALAGDDQRGDVKRLEVALELRRRQETDTPGHADRREHVGEDAPSVADAGGGAPEIAAVGRRDLAVHPQRADQKERRQEPGGLQVEPDARVGLP